MDKAEAQSGWWVDANEDMRHGTETVEQAEAADRLNALTAAITIAETALREIASLGWHDSGTAHNRIARNALAAMRKAREGTYGRTRPEYKHYHASRETGSHEHSYTEKAEDGLTVHVHYYRHEHNSGAERHEHDPDERREHCHSQLDHFGNYLGWYAHQHADASERKAKEESPA